MKISLVLEGGGMRGAYTTGVLDFFLDKNIEFYSIYGVSAGAFHACSFISKQRGRAFATNVNYLDDKRYASLSNLIKTGYYFGKEMLMEIIPNELEPFDFEAFKKNKTKFYAVVTNCNTGKAEYHYIRDTKKDASSLFASGSLPLLSKEIEVNYNLYLDGGISDSIPVKQALKTADKAVVILTRDKSYRKRKSKGTKLLKVKYSNYPKLLETMENRYKAYNDSLDYINNNPNVFVIRPKQPVEIGRIEKNKEKLTELHIQGYNDAKDCYDQLIEFMERR